MEYWKVNTLHSALCGFLYLHILSSLLSGVCDHLGSKAVVHFHFDQFYLVYSENRIQW
jgi:hypothetical protein